MATVRFLTLIGLLVTTAVDLTDAVTCSIAGWTPFETTGNCYLPVRMSMNYYNADSYCRNLGGAVASITSAAEMAFVNMLYGGNNYWIGLRNVLGYWAWSDATTTTYLNWRSGQPDNCCGTDVTCAIANYGDLSGLWDDTGCANTWNGFVCKGPGVNSSTATTTAASATTTNPCINGVCPDGYVCDTATSQCVQGTNPCINDMCFDGYACYNGQCVLAPNNYSIACTTTSQCTMGVCNNGWCVG